MVISWNWKHRPELFLIYSVAVGEYIDRFGKKKIKTEWKRAEKGLDIGSVKIRKNILEIKYVTQNELDKIFDGT